MKKIKIITAISLFVLPLMLGGCDDIFKLRDKTYQGKDLIEFFPDNATVTERDESSDAVVTVTTDVNLISSKGLAQSNLTIAYSVDDSSTAIAGTDYTITAPSPLSIAEGTTTTQLSINITADGLTSNDVRVLYITLSGNDSVSPSENYKTLQVIIRGEDEDADACPNYEACP